MVHVDALQEFSYDPANIVPVATDLPYIAIVQCTCKYVCRYTCAWRTCLACLTAGKALPCKDTTVYHRTPDIH